MLITKTITSVVKHSVKCSMEISMGISLMVEETIETSHSVKLTHCTTSECSHIKDGGTMKYYTSDSHKEYYKCSVCGYEDWY